MHGNKRDSRLDTHVTSQLLIHRISAIKRPNREQHSNKLKFGRDGLYDVLSHQKKVWEPISWWNFLAADFRKAVARKELRQNNLLINFISFTFSSITRAMIIGKTSMNPHFKFWNIVIPMMLTLWRNFKRIREKKSFEWFSFEKKRKIFEKKNFKVHFRHFPVRNRVWTIYSHF